MASEEQRTIHKSLFESLETNIDLLQLAQNKTEELNCFKSELLLTHSEVAEDVLVTLSSTVTRELSKELNEITLEDGFPEDELHTCFNLLHDLDKISSQREILLDKMKQDLAQTTNQTKLVVTEEQDLLRILKAREVAGEMPELRGYSEKDLTRMTNKAKQLFNTHKQKLKVVLQQLFPNHSDQMKELLNHLTDLAFGSSGNDFINLRDHPKLQDAAMALLQQNIVEQHPNDPKQVQLCIFD